MFDMPLIQEAFVLEAWTTHDHLMLKVYLEEWGKKNPTPNHMVIEASIPHIINHQSQNIKLFE